MLRVGVDAEESGDLDVKTARLTPGRAHALQAYGRARTPNNTGSPPEATMISRRDTGGATVAVATSVTWFLTHDPVPAPGRVGALVLAGMVASGCWAVIGAVVAVVTQGQIAAAASLVTYLMMVEPLLEVSERGIARLLPGRAAVDLFTVESVSGVGAMLHRLAVPVAVLVGVACVLVGRRDVAVTTR